MDLEIAAPERVYGRRVSTRELNAERKRVFVELAEVFRPFVSEFARNLLSFSREDVQHFRSDIGRPPEVEPFPRSYDELRERITELVGTTSWTAPTFRSRPYSLETLLFEMLHNGRAERPPGVATAGFPEFMWQRIETIPCPQQLIRFVICPVGEHGRAHAQRLTEATRILLLLTEQLALDSSRNLTTEHRALIATSTARGRDHKYIADAEKHLARAPAIALQEGLISLMHTVALMTAERHPPLSADQQVHAVINADLPTQVARTVKMGRIGPMVFAGMYIPGLVRYLQGEARLDPDVSAAFAAERRAVWQQPDEWHTDKLYDVQTGQTGHGCPVGRPPADACPNALTELSAAFRHVYDSLALP